MIPPFSSLLLVNRITIIIPDKIQANYTIKSEPLGKIMC